MRIVDENCFFIRLFRQYSSMMEMDPFTIQFSPFCRNPSLEFAYISGEGCVKKSLNRRIECWKIKIQITVACKLPHDKRRERFSSIFRMPLCSANKPITWLNYQVDRHMSECDQITKSSTNLNLLIQFTSSSSFTQKRVFGKFAN
jgi:hypothetical protein